MSARSSLGSALLAMAGAVVVAPPGLALAQGPADRGDGGAYVMVPSSPPPEPPAEEYVEEDGELYLGMLAARPFATYLGEGPSADDPETVVGGHVGLRAHALGIDDELLGRADLEAFLGASSEGVEGEGRVFLAVGLAHAVAPRHHLMFRIGAGGALLGNPVVDYQVADLPALEMGWVHTGPVVVEVAPRAAMGIVQMSAFDGSIEPDPAPAVGGRVLAGGRPVWAELDVDLVTGERPIVFGALTACYAEKLALCLDARLASASLDFGAGGFDRVTAVSGGLSIGLGGVTTKE